MKQQNSEKTRIEVATTYTEKQKEFLRLASRMKITPNMFHGIFPEVRFEEEYDPSLPTIGYIHTGGTLMMVPSKREKSALSFEGAIDIPKVLDVCDYVAQVRQKYNILGIYLANIDSKEIQSDLWSSIACTIRTIYERVHGVVVGHGTHTLEYSSASTAFALRNLAIPVVYTASQMPIIGFSGSDGLPNLTGALEIAAHGNIAETVVYTNGEINRAVRTTKKNDKRLNIYEARVTGPVGYYGAGAKIGAGEVELLSGVRRRDKKAKHELLFQPEFSDSVSIIKNNPSFSTEVLETVIGKGKDVGIIFESYGSGAIPNKFVPVLSRHAKEGFPIYVTSSCTESGISGEMQSHDEDAIIAYQAGIRNARDMTTSAATVKLMSITAAIGEEGKHNPQKRIEMINEQMMERNYAGEITLYKELKEDF